MWFLNRSDTYRAVQAQKRARSLKFRTFKVEEELYYPSSENKGADQLRSYCKADLSFCFGLCRLLVFPCAGFFIELHWCHVVSLSKTHYLPTVLVIIQEVIAFIMHVNISSSYKICKWCNQLFKHLKCK